MSEESRCLPSGRRGYIAKEQNKRNGERETERPEESTKKSKSSAAAIKTNHLNPRPGLIQYSVSELCFSNSCDNPRQFCQTDPGPRPMAPSGFGRHSLLRRSPGDLSHSADGGDRVVRMKRHHGLIGIGWSPWLTGNPQQFSRISSGVLSRGE